MANELNLNMLGSEIVGIGGFNDIMEEQHGDEKNTLLNEEEIKEKEKTDVKDDKGSQENVGNLSEKDNPSLNDTSSPNILTSIAQGLFKDGILFEKDIDIDKISIEDGDSFGKFMQEKLEAYYNERLTEDQKRYNLLSQGDADVNLINGYERTIEYLGNITEEHLKDEQNENLRKEQIFHNCITSGMSEERAARYVETIFKEGTDIEESIKSWKENTTYYNKIYQDTLSDIQKKVDANKKVQKDNIEKFKNKIIDTEEPFNGVKLSKIERTKLMSSITKPVHKDDNGNMLTQRQKYAVDNPIDYQYNIELLFYLTDGFKNLDSIVSQKVKEEKQSALSKINDTLKGNNSMLRDKEIDKILTNNDEIKILGIG